MSAVYVYMYMFVCAWGTDSEFDWLPDSLVWSASVADGCVEVIRFVPYVHSSTPFLASSYLNHSLLQPSRPLFPACAPPWWGVRPAFYQFFFMPLLLSLLLTNQVPASSALPPLWVDASGHQYIPSKCVHNKHGFICVKFANTLLIDFITIFKFAYRWI